MPSAPFCGQVFKTTIDHFAGRIDYVRVFSGTLQPGRDGDEPPHPEPGARGPLPPHRRRAERRGEGGRAGRLRGAGEAQGRAHRRHPLRSRRPILLPDFAPAHPAGVVRGPRQGRRRQGRRRAAEAHRGGPVARAGALPRHRRDAAAGHGAGAHRGDGRAGEAQARGGGDPVAAHAGLPRDHHRKREGAGQVQAADRRPRPVRRRPRRAAAEGPRRGLRVRGRHRGRRHPPPVHPVGGEGHPRRARLRPAGRLPGGRLPGEARLRQLPRRGQLGHGVPGGRLDGLQEGGARGAAHPARADHEARGAGAGGVRRAR